MFCQIKSIGIASFATLKHSDVYSSQMEVIEQLFQDSRTSFKHCIEKTKDDKQSIATEMYCNKMNLFLDNVELAVNNLIQGMESKPLENKYY